MSGRGYGGGRGGGRGVPRGGGRGRGDGGGRPGPSNGPIQTGGPSITLDQRQEFTNKKKDFEAVLKKAQDNDKGSGVFVLRPGFASGSVQQNVYTNHFALDLPKEDLYQYKVFGFVTEEQEVENKLLPRARMKELMEQAVAGSSILSNHKSEYATNTLENIIAWKDLSLYAKKKAPAQACDVVEGFQDLSVSAGGPMSGKPGAIIETFEIMLREGFEKPDGTKVKATMRKLSLRFEGRLPVSKIAEASKGKIDELPLDPKGENTMTVVQAINIIIGHSARSSPDKKVFQVRTNKFFSTNSDFKLGQGLIGYKGFFFTLRHGMGQPLLNVSSASCAFYEKSTVAQFMTQYGARDPRTLKSVLKGVRVAIIHEGREKSITHISDKTPSEITFKDKDGKEISVAKHLQSNSKISPQTKQAILSSKCFCVQLGSGPNAKHFPAETLGIVPYQPFTGKLPPQVVSNMINSARVFPEADRSNIQSSGLALFGAGTAQSSVLKNAGLNIKPAMVKVPANIISPPTITYNTNQAVRFGPGKGRWNLKDNVMFFQRNNSKFPKTVVLFHSGDHDIMFGRKCASELVEAMKKYGGQQPVYQREERMFSCSNFASYYQSEIQKLQASGKEDILAILINPEDQGRIKGPDFFPDFKRISDRVLGVHSICMKADSAYKQQGSLGQYMANVALKVNAKLGHTNHKVALPNDVKPLMASGVGANQKFDTMILGADATHPPPGGSGPSITAVVGSVDEFCSKFFGSVRYQRGGEEIIYDMHDMVKERLRAWYKAHKSLPSKILFYRDGVSESQYTAVLQQEVRKVESAYESTRQELSPTKKSDLKLTTVIVTKRHHTRFYPEGPGNCSHGTCVDSGVTHPCYFDFFLQSHNPVQGTAKPTYYFVLRNDMGFSAKQIQELTNHLCYAYIRCTLPVGYVPAAYYADRLCERARLYVNHVDAVTDPVFKAAGLHNKPSKPAAPKRNSKDGQTFEQKKAAQAKRTQELQAYAQQHEEWQERVTQAWRTKHCGPNPGVAGGVNAEGPWHANLNNNMFWI